MKRIIYREKKRLFSRSQEIKEAIVIEERGDLIKVSCYKKLLVQEIDMKILFPESNKLRRLSEIVESEWIYKNRIEILEIIDESDVIL